jgi:hypothetical protein
MTEADHETQLAARHEFKRFEYRGQGTRARCYCGNVTQYLDSESSARSAHRTHQLRGE